MIRHLFQGVEDVVEQSSQLQASSIVPSLISDPSSVNPDSDKLREECGVVAIHGHPDAARQAYLGL